MGKKSKTIFAIILILIVGTLITLLALNWKVITSKSKLYTYDDIKSAYNDGLAKNNDLLDKKDAQLELYKLRINDANVMAKSNQEQINLLVQQIALIQSRLDSAIAENEENAIWRANYLSMVNQLEMYRDALNVYIDANECTVAFMVGDEIIDFRIITKGSTIVDVPQVTFDNGCYDIFNYWTLNGSQVNPVGIQITENTEFVADITNKYKVTVTVGETTTEHIVTSLDEITILSAEPDEIFGRFDGWLINNATEPINDLSTVQMSNNMIIRADIKQKITVSVNKYINNPNGGYTCINTKTVDLYISGSYLYASKELLYILETLPEPGEVIGAGTVAPASNIKFNGVIYGFYGIYLYDNNDSSNLIQNLGIGFVLFDETKTNCSIGIYYSTNCVNAQASTTELNANGEPNTGGWDTSIPDNTDTGEHYGDR